ncbi:MULTISPECIES: aspartate kinase [Psychrilyobacter]|nr:MULTISPECIES: aspartate kinase [Psychrilyobacter]MCS5423148.1 aspartate kinase [Psychrilyobacter sp. S5]
MRLVQKYGGSSVESINKIKKIAKNIASLKRNGKELVVVVSAMGKRTDELLKKARSVSKTPNRRELDRLLSIGEQETIALLTIALHEEGIDAISYTGYQAGITTTGLHTKSRIKKIDTQRIEKSLDDGKLVIVAGFQGINKNGDITTLGRGGSDTSAVALSAALNCPCEIYTDVNGIHTVDPKVYGSAKKLDCISYEEMMEMSKLGAGIMEVRAVELGKKFRVPIYVGRALGKIAGTNIKEKSDNMEEKVITGLSINERILMIEIQNIEHSPQEMAYIFSELSRAHVNVDMISQIKGFNLSFTCPLNEEELFDNAMKKIMKKLPNIENTKNRELIKISLVGIGIMGHFGVISSLFEVFAEENINFYKITTSEISISYIIDRKNMKKAVTALAKAFNL